MVDVLTFDKLLSILVCHNEIEMNGSEKRSPLLIRS